MRPWSIKRRCRSSSFRWLFSSSWRISSWRRVSTSSSGVGVGWISSSGAPARTKSPTSANSRLTTPEIFDLTLTSTSGSIRPTASALSTMVPRSTATVFSSSSPAPPLRTAA